MRHVLAAVVCVACLAGCKGTKKEAERVAAALDRMRDARGEARPPLLEELERMKIEGDVAREARDTCVAVFRALHDANTQLDAAKAALDDGAVKDAAGTVAGAVAKLEEARAGIAACNSKVVALKASIR